ncbi:MAG: hypothetical protein HYT07_00270 [Candidatus Levybacteria bacterium]|nr:hypothetical protein [Candidatus Levybacteria bacterium]
MNTAMKEKLPLIVGIVLPFFLILYVAITAYVPSFFVKPKYNFVYTNNYNNDYNINVIDGRINFNLRYIDSTNRNYVSRREPTLFLYDVAADKSTQIILTQAQAYILDPSNKSPDGFTVGRSEYNSYSYFPFFFGGSNRGVYLMGKGLNRKITDQDSYYFKLVGWVVNE